MNTRRMGRFGGGAGHVAMLPTGHVAYWPCCHVPRGHVAYWPCCQRSCLLARGGSDHMRFVLFFFLSSMPATAMHSSEQCTARVPTLLCPTGLTSQRTMPASTFLENTPSPRQTRRINNSRNNDKQEEEEEGACEKEEEEGRGDSFGHVAATVFRRSLARVIQVNYMACVPTSEMGRRVRSETDPPPARKAVSVSCSCRA